jgi:hypothetical protein
MHAAMRKALSIAIASLAVACASPERGLELTQRPAPAGTNLHVKIVEVTSATAVVNEWVPINSTALDVTYGLSNDSYRAYVYEDLDGDGRCTAADHAWQVAMSASPNLVRVDLGATSQDSTACAQFSP